ncbi:MAG: tetratricopeptide repeat protein [Rhizobiaceae bacterium]
MKTKIIKSLSILFAGGLLAGSVVVSKALAENSPQEIIATSDSFAGNYLAARIAATDKDTENAVVFYRKALEIDPDNTGLKMQGFLNFVANGNFSEGVLLGQEISKNSNSPEIVSLILAVEDLRKKSWANAERRLDKPWRSALDRLMAGIVLGWVKHGQGKTDEALKSVDGLKGPAWFDLFVQYHGGLLALAGGDTKGAIKRLDKAFKNRAGGQAASETYMRALGALIQAHWKQGDKKKAKELVIAGLKRAPQSPIFERKLANIEADKAPGFAPLFAQRGAAEVFLNLGTAVDKEGGEQFARIYLQLANVLAPDDDVITAQLGQVYDKQGLLVRANALFESIPDKSALKRITRLERALNLDELEELDEARKELDLLVEQTPDDLVLHLSYGAVLARHEDFKGAIDIYSGIIGRLKETKRYHWNLFYRQGIAYERTKQWPKAEASFKKALKLFPNQPNVLNYLGYSWIDMNTNLQEGLDMIRKAVELRPNDGYMVDSLGWAYFRMKRYSEAVVEMERAVELRPGDPTINDHLGDTYWRANRKLEATFQWRHALALDPPKADIGRIEDKLENGLDSVVEKELAAKKKMDKG